MAASTKTSRRPRYLSVTAPGSDSQPRPPAPPTAVVNQSSASIWRFYKEDDGSYELTTTGRNANTEAFLRTSEDGKLDSVEKPDSADESMERDRRWKIVEYWPPVLTGTYRIRTLNGAALDIDPNMSQLSATAVRKDYRQEWNVEPKGNGKCIISLNVKEKLYLGWEKGKDGIAQIAPTKQPFEWFVKSLGEYTYSITIDYAANAQTTLTLALSIADAEVLLKPRKTAHNQIWFFEQVDATSTTHEVPPPYTETQRYAEIVERNYKILNVSTGRYFAIHSDSDPWRVAPYAAADSGSNLRYVDTGNTFRINHTGYPNKYVRVAGNVLEVVDGISTGGIFVLERADDPRGGYMYYILNAADRSQVVSGAATTTNGKEYLTVTTKKYGDGMLQWKFSV